MASGEKMRMVRIRRVLSKDGPFMPDPPVEHIGSHAHHSRPISRYSGRVTQQGVLYAGRQVEGQWKRRGSERYHRIMFAFLRGTVAHKGVGYLELDVNGVGYAVSTPELCLRKLTQGATATLLTHCHIREDAFQIFGFLQEEERAAFRLLLGLTGVGPKVALAILSAMPVKELARAVMENDVAAFTRVSGVGKKSAQRIVLELKTKLGQDAELGAILGEGDETAVPESDDVMAALCSLGCTAAEARTAAAKARAQMGEGATVEDLIRAALRTLSKV